MFRRYECVRQVDDSDCGAAALATIARYHGITFGLQAMRDLAGTDRIGTNLLGLLGAAERLGFAAKAVEGSYEALAAAPLPAIAHVHTPEGLGHFVVLHRASKKSVVIADPARGVEKLTRDEFCATWTGYLLLMTPDETAAQVRPEHGEISSPMLRFASLLQIHRGLLVEGFVCAVLMTLLGITTSYFVQHLVDSVLVRGEARFLNALGVGMVMIVLFRTLFGAVRHSASAPPSDSLRNSRRSGGLNRTSGAARAHDGHGCH